MGLDIDRDRFEEPEYERFSRRLEECLAALGELLARPGFGVGEASLGAELEVSLVDAAARPLSLNQDVIAASGDPGLTVELARFNLECNLPHGPVAGRPFAALGRAIEHSLEKMRRAAAARGGRVALVGILPTLGEADLGPAAMTDSMRFRALSAGIRRLRREPFRLHIQGEEQLRASAEDVTFEGANTSLQLHLRVDPADFAATYDAAQAATAPVLAVAGNSPILLGRLLWDETRIALFKQAVDDRQGSSRSDRPARVSFGRSWLRDGPYELFAEAVRLHEPLLPILDAEEPAARLAAGELPALRELRLHHGTVWRWNRAIYDPAEGGHVRIEMRALPSGPTVADMLANAAFLVGLSLGLAPEAANLRRALPFETAHRNFYRAAQSGLAAELVWPGEGAQSAAELALGLLPVARQGLDRAGVDAGESAALLGLIEARVRSGMTGARWQRRALAALERRQPRSEALAAMLEAYLEHSTGGEPVHAWPRPEEM